MEINGAETVQEKHLRGLRAFGEEYVTRRNIIVSRDKKPRRIGNILVLPWQHFLEQLWEEKIL